MLVIPLTLGPQSPHPQKQRAEWWSQGWVGTVKGPGACSPARGQTRPPTAHFKTASLVKPAASPLPPGSGAEARGL